MKINYFLILGLTSIIMSCGPSQKEIEEREKFVADSLRIAKEYSIAKAKEQMEKFVADSLRIAKEYSIAKAKEQIEKERIHKEKIEVGKSINKRKLKKIFDELTPQLQKEKKKLDQINEFQFGRSLSTKQQQLRNQNEKINELAYFIDKVEKEISMSNLFNSFDFQLTPQGTVEHIFTSAKSGDFSKMRHILDPYGEYDSDAKQICLVEMLPLYRQEEWKRVFENGRMMSDPVIKGDKAEIEIAIGSSSNRLEKINLVRRMDKWYIKGM